jgi:TrmH family RNA methyltransferase
MISSTKNPKVQWIRRLQSKGKERQAEGVFILEGVRLLEEAFNSHWKVEFLAYTDDLGDRGKDIVEAYRKLGTLAEVVSPPVMRVMSDTKNPQGLLAVLNQQKLSVPSQLDYVLILDQMREPGNLGAILRSATAAGVQLVCLTPGTVDPYSPKVLRAGMGAQLKLPIRVNTWSEIETQIKHSMLFTYLAQMNKGEVYHQSNLSRPLALIIGSEADGASEEAHHVADSLIQIPMPGGGESLNASVSAGILLFEIARQREMDK